MLQNLITLMIVFTAGGYTVFSVFKSITVKKSSKCGGCAGCSLKELPTGSNRNSLNNFVKNF